MLKRVIEDGENEVMVQHTPAESDALPPKVRRRSLAEKYQRESYVAIQEHGSNKEEIMHWAIGLGEEAGEVLSVVKHKYYGGKYAVEDLVSELGDTLWHIAALCTASGIQLEDVFAYNLAKLAHRYPKGSFDHDRSVDRRSVDSEFKGTPQHREIMDRIEAHQEANSTDWKQDV